MLIVVLSNKHDCVGPNIVFLVSVTKTEQHKENLLLLIISLLSTYKILLKTLFASDSKQILKQVNFLNILGMIRRTKMGYKRIYCQGVRSSVTAMGESRNKMRPTDEYLVS
jgi:hypothetical protein